jgi:hypothetical protein
MSRPPSDAERKCDAAQHYIYYFYNFKNENEFKIKNNPHA